MKWQEVVLIGYQSSCRFSGVFLVWQGSSGSSSADHNKLLINILAIAATTSTQKQDVHTRVHFYKQYDPFPETRDSQFSLLMGARSATGSCTHGVT
mmetsp:Transcript_25962/g.46836  ORF Transcript_25962/g.46836 Transcript_25962/m.46836 type:complete len:96 (-) Transcript_25962:824-1111(-)